MTRNPGRPASNRNADGSAIERNAALKLLAYCRANHFAGYDPYDALNSRLFRALPILNFKAARLLLTQAVKRSPINLRPWLLVPKSPNPKGLALFLASLIKLTRIGLVDEPGSIDGLAATLLSLRSPGRKEFCWGYNFDWQTRGALVPRGSPNIICTTFAANALLDAYEWRPEPLWLEAALSSAEFILDSLLWRRDGEASFCYTPIAHDRVHNANLLGAAFLCRAGRVGGRERYFSPALEAARTSVRGQRENGSWAYGELPSQSWIDNFHTGFNLGALRKIGAYAETPEFEPSIQLGFRFYKDHFFRPDGAPKYYHDAAYPFDIHSVAQSVITLVEFEGAGREPGSMAEAVLRWGLANMWNARKGFFYFQKRPLYTVRVPFMRWSEAWMLLALSTFLESRAHA
jgi:hypothetical protein